MCVPLTKKKKGGCSHQNGGCIFAERETCKLKVNEKFYADYPNSPCVEMEAKKNCRYSTDLTEDEYDAVIAEEAYKEYIDSGCKSIPAEEFWKTLDG